jgi:formamidopyrimidine-DNA glycosylase
MPELPEVEMARRYLEKSSLHQTIRGTEIRDARILKGADPSRLRDALAGREIRAVYSTRASENRYRE